MVAKALVMDSRETRSSSTIRLSPPCSTMAFCSAAALAAWRVVSTVTKPSRANFCAMAPPTPQRIPTGRWLSSTALPCANLVLRPSLCHLEVAPTTTATGLLAALIGYSSLVDVSLRPFPYDRTDNLLAARDDGRSVDSQTRPRDVRESLLGRAGPVRIRTQINSKEDRPVLLVHFVPAAVANVGCRRPRPFLPRYLRDRPLRTLHDLGASR